MADRARDVWGHPASDDVGRRIGCGGVIVYAGLSAAGGAALGGWLVSYVVPAESSAEEAAFTSLFVVGAVLAGAVIGLVLVLVGVMRHNRRCPRPVLPADGAGFEVLPPRR